MKRSAFIATLFLLALTACEKNKPAEAPVAPASPLAPGTPMPADHPPTTMNALAPSKPSSTPPSAPTGTVQYLQTEKGTVVNFVNIPEFTYIEISQNGKNRWLAAKTVAVKKGDVIKFDPGSTMDNFNSKSLNRTFASMTFVNRVSISN